MGEPIKVYRDDTGQWFTIDSRGRARNPYSPESCAILDRLLLNLPPAKPPEQPCEVCGGDGMFRDGKGRPCIKTCSKCGGTGKKGGV